MVAGQSRPDDRIGFTDFQGFNEKLIFQFQFDNVYNENLSIFSKDLDFSPKILPKTYEN